MALVNGPMNSVLFPMSRDRLIRNDYYSEFGGLCGLEDELLLRLTEAKHALKNDPLGQISSQFSMFFYATHPEFKCGRNIFLRLWQLLRILLRQIAQEIDCSDENINQQQESVSMYIFLACEYLIKASTMVSSGYVGLKKTARRDSNDRDIIELQIQTMSTLNELLTSNAVCSLYKSLSFDRNFDLTIIQTYFTCLECQPLSKSANFQDLFNTGVSFIVRTLNDKVGFYVKLIQSICNHVTTVQILAKTAVFIVSECPPQGQRSFIAAILKSVVECIVYTEPKSKKHSHLSYKNMGQFLYDLSCKLPAEMSHELEYLFELLGSEVHHLRTSIVNCFLEIYLRYLRTHESNEENIEATAEAKDKIELVYSVLTDRVRDTNAFTRNAALHAWERMFKEKAIHFDLFSDSVMCCADRILDASNLVRRCALSTITASLRYNPFADDFDLDTIQKNTKNSAEVIAMIERGEEVDMTNNEKVDIDEMKKVHRFWEQNLKFLGIVQKCIEDASLLLRLHSATDVCPAVEFIVFCMERKAIKDTKEVCTRLFQLAWTKDRSIRQSVTRAYSRVHLEPNAASFTQLVNGILGSLEGMPKYNFPSIAIILSELVKKEDNVTGVVRCLDESATLEVLLSILFADEAEHSSEKKYWAIIVLKLILMHSKSGRTFIRDRLETITRFAIVEITDFKLKKEFFSLLVTCADLIVDKNKICEAVIQTTIDSFSICDKPGWPGMADEVVALIFNISRNPLTENKRLVCDCLHHLKQRYRSSSQKSSQNGSHNAALPKQQILNFTSLCGSVAQHFMQFMNTELCNDLKDADAVCKILKFDRHELDLDDTLSTSLNASRLRRSTKATHEYEAPDELESLFIEEIQNNHALKPGSLLQMCAEVTRKLVMHSQDYSNHSIEAAAACALGRFMIISDQYCEENMTLLISKLTHVSSPLVKQCMLTILCDVLIKHPNEISRWANIIFGFLQDPVFQVRLAALRCVCRLILKEMVKLKGFLAQVVNCLVDSNQEVKEIAEFFFGELSKRDNGEKIHALLPDIITNLSKITHSEEGKDDLSEDFKSCMKFLICNFCCKKDKHCESTIDRLCQRINGNTDLLDCRNTAYCISLVRPTEMSIRRMIQNFGFYKVKLSDDIIYTYMHSLIVAARRPVGGVGGEDADDEVIGNVESLGKKEISKDLIDELSRMFEEARNVGVDGIIGSMHVPSSLSVLRRGVIGKGRSRATSQRQSTKRKIRKRTISSDSEFDFEDQSVASRCVKRHVILSSDDDDSFV